jgi:hypothetical protein
LLISVHTTLFAQQLPRIEGDSLSGRHVVLPAAASGKVAVLILGFSKASKTPTAAWEKKITSDFSTQQVQVYQLPVLEEVPRIIRGMVISSMKGAVAAEKQDRFIPLLHGESELKKLVDFEQPADAYLIVLGPSSEIDYKTHGSIVTEAGYAQVREHIQLLLK